MLKVAIVGRVNVGKSTLFNSLVGSAVSLVWKEPGTTRDVVEAIVHSERRDYLVMDTAGYFLTGHPLQQISEKMSDQAMAVADIIIAVFDAKTGPNKLDWHVRDKVLKSGKPYIFVVNKVDNKLLELSAYDLFSNFLDDFIMTSAVSKKGIDEIFSRLDEIADKIEVSKAISEDDFYSLPSEKIGREIDFESIQKKIKEKSGEEQEEKRKFVRISFVGRPNVGKSSLVNAILGYQRCIVYEEPGTTRDAIRIPFYYKDYKFVIVDTPGIRRRSKIDKDSVEYKAVGGSVIAMSVSDVVILVVDSFEGITHQDKHLASFVERSGSALVVALNKIDIIKKMKPAGGIRKFVQALEGTMPFIKWAYFVPTSATEKYGIEELLDSIVKSYLSWSKKLKPSELIKIKNNLERLNFMKFQNPKIFQIGIRPPKFLLWVNDPSGIRKYQVSHVEKILRQTYDFRGTPLHFRIKAHGENF